MNIKIIFFVCLNLFVLSRNIIQTQTLLKKSPYYTNPSETAKVMPKDVKIKPYTGVSTLRSIDTDTRRYFEDEITKAFSLLENDKNIEAIDMTYNIESIFDNSYLIYFIRAKAYQNIGDSVYAKKGYDKALAFFPLDEDLYFQVAEFYALIGQYEEALRVYITAFKVFDDDMWLFLAGSLSLENDDIPSANYYYMSLKDSRLDAYFYEGMGKIEFRVGEYNTALEVFELAFKRYINTKKYDTLLSDSTDNVSRISKLMENSSIEISIKSWKEFFLDKNFQSALDVLSKLTSYTTSYPSLMLYSGKTHFEMGNYAEAKNILTSAVRVAPELEESYIILAQIYSFENNYIQAVRILESGFKHSYDKPQLYDALINLLYDRGSTYYPNKIIGQVGNFYNFNPKNKIKYAEYLTSERKYNEAEELLFSINPPVYEANLVLKQIEYKRLLDKAQVLYEKKLHLEIMKLLSSYKFTGTDEDMRLRYLANAYQMLGSVNKAIDVLEEKYKTRNISINNLIFLRHLLDVRRKEYDTDQSQKDKDLITIKATLFLQEELSSNIEYVKNRIMEFVKYSQFQEAINYLEEIKRSGLNKQEVVSLESTIYTYYARYLGKEGDLVLAQNLITLALARNPSNFDAIATKRDIEIQVYLNSLGNYTDDPAYVIMAAAIEHIVSLQPAYFKYKVLLASCLVKEHDLSGFTIASKLRNISTLPGRYYSIFAKIYFEAGFYDYAKEYYEIAIDNNSNNKDILIEYASLLYSNNIKYYDDAISILENILKVYPDDPDIYYHMSKAYSSKGKNLNIALGFINKALSINPNVPYYLYQKSYIYEMLGSIDNALDGYATISKLYKNYTIAHYKTSFILLNIYNDANAAEPYALTYSSFTPKSYQGDILLATIYERQSSLTTDPKKERTLLDDATVKYEKAYKNSIWGADRLIRVELYDMLNAIELDITQ